MSVASADGAIGIFDSGVGGLTVLHALRDLLPHEHLIYLGDTARLPYGTKSPETVQRYAAHAAGWLMRQEIKLLVVACNTASALALESLRERVAPVPVIGVVEPGAAMAVSQSVRQHHLVLATEATTTQRAYTRAIHALRPEAVVEELPCSLFVALAEEGWSEDAVARAAAEKYLGVVRSRDSANRPDTAILGCTHFPLLRAVIADALGPEIVIVDSASTTAAAVVARLEQLDMRNSAQTPGRLRLVATDGTARFARTGSAFLGQSFSPGDIELTDIHPSDIANAEAQ